MSLSSRVPGAVTALALALSAVTVLGPVARASASEVRTPGCRAPHLRVVEAGTEAATSHRYVKFRITNVGDRACRLYGYPTFRYRKASGHPAGYRSAPAGVKAHAVRLAPGGHTNVTLGYVVPGVTLPRQCHATRIAAVTFRLAFRPRVYERALHARVCTTKMYRPTSYPAGF